MGRPSWAPSGVDMDQPSIARVYDTYLGGYHNFACDRELAERTMKIVPEAPLLARAFRAFLSRVVRYLVDNGIDQFLDLGSGIPTVGNVHEIAQQANPQARVAYVDIDPVAVAHSQAILVDNDRVVTIQADLRQPQQVLGDADLRRILDFDRPIALLMLAVLHFVPDADDPVSLVAEYYDALAPGSYLAISHGSAYGRVRERIEAGVSEYKSAVAAPVQLRTHEEIAALFHRFELVAPGLVPVGDWGSDSAVDDSAPPPIRFGYGGLGRKQ